MALHPALPIARALRTTRHVLVCAFVGALSTQVLAANKCTDAQGRTIYQDLPCQHGPQTAAPNDPKARGASADRAMAASSSSADLMAKRNDSAKAVSACEVRRTNEAKRQIALDQAGKTRTEHDASRLRALVKECEDLQLQHDALSKTATATGKPIT